MKGCKPRSRQKFTLDEDVSRLVPELGKAQITTDFDDVTGKAKLTKTNAAVLGGIDFFRHGFAFFFAALWAAKRPSNLQLAFIQTAAHPQLWLRLDLTIPLFTKYQTVERGLTPWAAPTIEERCNFPLLFEPGTGWNGVESDWAGKMTERATGLILDEYMVKNLLELIGAKDIVFWPLRRPDLIERKADLSIWDESGKKAIPLIGFDGINGSKNCLGGCRCICYCKRLHAYASGGTAGRRKVAEERAI